MSGLSTKARSARSRAPTACPRRSAFKTATCSSARDAAAAAPKKAFRRCRWTNSSASGKSADPAALSSHHLRMPGSLSVGQRGPHPFSGAKRVAAFHQQPGGCRLDLWLRRGMLRAESYLDPPAGLAERHFERYIETRARMRRARGKLVHVLARRLCKHLTLSRNRFSRRPLPCAGRRWASRVRVGRALLRRLFDSVAGAQRDARYPPRRRISRH